MAKKKDGKSRGRRRADEVDPGLAKDDPSGGRDPESALDPAVLEALECLSDEEAAALPAARDIPELGKRNGKPLKPASIRFLVASLTRQAMDGGVAQALLYESQGSLLRFLYSRLADVVLKRKDFWEFGGVDCGMSKTTMRRRMYFARDVTRDEAQFYGYELCLVGIRLKRLEKVERIADLDGREFTVPESACGGVVVFARHANAARLDAAATLIADRLAKPELVDEGVEAVANRMRNIVAEELEKDAALRRAGPRVTVYAGRIGVANKPVYDRQALAALSRLLERLSRVRGFAAHREQLENAE